jgi:hypothetical protein
MNVTKLSITTALGLAGLLVGTTHADATKWYDKVTLGGYVDAYYQQMLGGDGVTVSTPSKRVFDNQANDFNFGGGELTLSSSDDSSKTGYYLDLILGPTADVINVANYSTAPNGLSGFMVGQGYVTKAMGDAKFTFGKFGTIIGTEVTNPLSNNNFSRGLVYSLEPVYSTGLKLDYSLPMDLALTGVIDNGNSIDKAGNEGKGYGLMLGYSGIKNLTSSVSYYGAPSSKTAAGISYQDFINVLIGFKAMDTLSFNAEYLYNTTIDTNTNIDPAVGPVAFSPKTQAVALYANWTTPMAGLSLLPRVEQVASPDGAVNNYVNNSYTLTLKYSDGPLTHFVEFRDDSSNGFNYSDGKVPPTFSQSQMTLTYAAAYGF